MKDQILLDKLRKGEAMPFRSQIQLVLSLAFPAILAQLTSVVMQYIDAAMVGQLGTYKSAAIGLMSTTLWLTGGVLSALSVGFQVQVAHKIGAESDREARAIMKHGFLTGLVFSAILLIAGVLIFRHLPYWLGGTDEIALDASRYLIIYVLALPILITEFMSSGMLQSSGMVKISSLISILICALDVVFNYLLIFPTRVVELFHFRFTIYGANLDVMGASLGTMCAETVGTGIMLYFIYFKVDKLRFRKEERGFHWTMYKKHLLKALKIGYPVAIEEMILGSAQVMITKIVSPLGAVALSANSFAITAESFCYMPGYGISVAGTTLIGQSIGANRKRLAGRFGYLVVGLGMAVMAGTGILLYVLAPWMMQILTPVEEVQKLGVICLRIEALAEPLFGAAIVSGGVFRGTGNTLKPSLINLCTMWLIRIPIAAYLATRVGLKGVWIAMCVDLMTRGAIFLVMLVLWNRKMRRENGCEK